MDITSLYANIPQEEGITIVCNAYENFYAQKPPIATNFLREMLTHPCFANIFMASIEKEILRQGVNKPLPWKRFIYDVFCLWDTNKEEIEHFIEEANSYHPTIKFTQEKMRGQRRRLPVQPLGYVMSTKVIFRRAEVFRDVRMQANLGPMFERK